jgi:Tol biopolymer transport system component
MKKNVSNLMQLLSLTIMLVFIAPVIMHAQAGKANFAGSWTYNESKSTPAQGGGGGGQRGGGSFTVAQEANLLSQTRTGQDGTPRVTKYTLDGKESINTTRGGDSKSTAKWSADGKSLTIVTKSDNNGTERISTAVWSLTDAKTLSIVNTRKGQDGTERKTTMVYDKK